MIKIDGEKIKRLRESQGLTQLYMATAVEVTTDTISRWENKRYPTIKEENGEKLAEALGVELDDILLIEDEPEISSDVAPALDKRIPEITAKNKKLTIVIITALLLLITTFTALFFSGKNSQPLITAKRIMPTRAIPGSAFPVVLEIQHTSTAPVSIILKEYLPPDCTILETSPEDGSSADGHELKWLKKITKTTRFSYLAKINGPTEKSFSFSGKVSTSNNNDTVNVAGINSIQLGKFHWADHNGDNQISDQEILTVFDYYSGIDDFTIDIEFIEKMWLGSSYVWDQTNNKITITP